MINDHGRAAITFRDMTQPSVIRAGNRPYSKWFGTAFARLPIAAQLAPPLQRALAATRYAAREAALVEVYSVLAHAHNARGLTAHVREMHDLAPVNAEDPAFIALYRELRERAAELGKRRGIPPEMLQQFMDGIQEPGQFADLVAFYVEMGTEAKQKLLEVLSVEERLRSLLLIVQRQLALIEAQEEIQAQVQEELGERQREMLLREQMKAIQRELGEEDEGAELEELKQKLDALELPEAAREEADRELGRLERTNPQSAEYQVIRT